MFISKAFHSILKTWIQMPSWMRWAGGACLAVGYSFLFYFFFVSPTGFRWRAIYGDPDYPEGYTIYGIDVSRYQGTINWNRLRNALIDRCLFVLLLSSQQRAIAILMLSSVRTSPMRKSMVLYVVFIISGVISRQHVVRLISSLPWFICSGRFTTCA